MNRESTRVISVIVILATLIFSTSGCHRSADSLGNVVQFEIVEVGGRPHSDHVIGTEVAGSDNQALLNRLRDNAWSMFPEGKWNNFGPDSSYRSIRLRCEHGVIELNSWHPIAESDPRIVASSYGLTSLKGKDRSEFLSGDDQDYVLQRKTYDDIEKSLLSLLRTQ